MDIIVKLPDALEPSLQQQVVAIQANSPSDYVSNIIQQHLASLAVVPARVSPGTQKPGRYNWQAIRGDGSKFLLYLGYWTLTAITVWIIHLFSVKTGLSWIDPADEATKFVFELMSGKHILPIISGPLIVLIIILGIYIPIRNRRVRETLSVGFDTSFEMIGEQLYHVIALLVVFATSGFIESNSNWFWLASVMIFLALEGCLLLVFAGGRAVRSK